MQCKNRRKKQKESPINTYPDVDPTVFIKAKIVAAKLGERSCGFCIDVIDIAPEIPSASDIRATDAYGLLPTNDKPISKKAGIKWAVDMTLNNDVIFCSNVHLPSSTYNILKNISLLHQGS